MSAPPPALERLQRQWAILAALGNICIVAVGGVLALRVGPNMALRWSIPSAIVLSWFLWRLRTSLDRNHAPDDPELHPSLGAANLITMVRAALTASLAGFLFLTPIMTAGTVWDWLPGLVYLSVAAMDGADGRLARITGNVTCLGAYLDTQADALGLLLAGLLLVISAKAPLPYLWVGIGYYVLQVAIRLRRAAGRPAEPVPPRPEARWAAGCQMVFAALALLPVMKPEATQPAAWLMTLAQGISLGQDWRIICRSAVTPDRTPPRERAVVARKVLARGLPLALRFAVAISLVLTVIATPDGRWSDVPTPVQAAVLACSGLCVLGVVARLAAMLLSLLCGFWMVPAMPAGAATVTLTAALSLVLTGAGDMRLWQPEDRILMSTRGEGAAH
ncbi:MAG: CDP-alcohol phosphatidyltransferase family protein [Desulfobacterales bacterium]|jgi:phosphatidylglycerophosphate synthase|nr:CDP-alcohol phosphatidyltransferase family protein [Desulfobacterales bacterium]